MVMQDIKWTEDLSVGVVVLDDDHKKLIKILNTLFAASFAGVADSVLEKTLVELEEYTKFHFDREEQFLAEHDYPSLEPHKFQHEKLIKDLHEYTARAREQGTDGLSADVMMFLRTWLINHIKEQDLVYADYLKEKA
ncbi:MAG: bacteriohemerythrin [Magnetovibrio sp.]|nr:bacteriohemerythrin [Magnetovibrio sp.]